MKYLLLVALLAASGCNSSRTDNKLPNIPAPEPILEPGQKPVYKVEVNIQDGVSLMNIDFSGRLPAPTEVDRILRSEFEKVIRKNPKQDALGYAYRNDDELTSNQFSGSLVYKAAEKRIMTKDEFDGVKTSSSSTDSYLLVTEEQSTLPSVKPKRTWLSLSLVFPKVPSQKEAYEAINVEIDKVRTRGLDVNAYVKVGDKNTKTSWYQVKDTDGSFVFAEYEASTGKVMRRGKLLRQF